MIRKLLILVLLLLVKSKAEAQMKAPFSFSSISIGSNAAQQMNYTYIDNGKCIFLSSGLSVFIRKPLTTAQFIAACIAPPVTPGTIIFNTFPISGYPNPTSDFVLIKAPGYSTAYNLIPCTLIVTNGVGQLVSKKEILVQDLRAGVRIDLKNQVSGVYYVTTIIDNIRENFKILKINGN
jgi:hypothetical protein